MKKLLFGLIALTTATSYSGVNGLPSEDPIVKSLRSRFEKAKSPTAEDLLDKNFSCVFQSASKGTFRTGSSVRSFQAHDGLYIMFEIDENPLLMVDNGKELIGVKNSGNNAGYDAIRVSENGDLLVEWSVTKTKPEYVLLPIADAGEGTAAINYSVCVPKP